MLNAIGLHHFRWRKKKVDGFIIPSAYFHQKQPISPSTTIQSETISSQTENIVKESVITNEPVSSDIHTNTVTPVSTQKTEDLQPYNQVSENEAPKISALSLSSIRAKKALQESTKSIIKETDVLPTEDFSETDLLTYWNKFALRAGEKGQRIMESLMLMNDPKVVGTTIYHELPNEGSKLDFDAGKNALIGYLRGHLHNHNIQIEIKVNETVETRHAFTPQEKFARLCERNPNLEILKKMFDLDL